VGRFVPPTHFDLPQCPQNIWRANFFDGLIAYYWVGEREEPFDFGNSYSGASFLF